MYTFIVLCERQRSLNIKLHDLLLRIRTIFKYISGNKINKIFCQTTFIKSVFLELKTIHVPSYVFRILFLFRHESWRRIQHFHNVALFTIKLNSVDAYSSELIVSWQEKHKGYYITTLCSWRVLVIILVNIIAFVSLLL